LICCVGIINSTERNATPLDKSRVEIDNKDYVDREAEACGLMAEYAFDRRRVGGSIPLKPTVEGFVQNLDDILAICA
jgi:hypothetical protein